MNKGVMTTTYSMWSLFRNCRKACELRYVQELVPIEREGSLAFGSLVHECLEAVARPARPGAGAATHRPGLRGAGRPTSGSSVTGTWRGR